MSTSNEYETSVKRIPFDGKQVNWRPWKNRAFTYSGVKGFRGALLRDLGKLITEEQYDQGAGTTSTGQLGTETATATTSTMTATTAVLTASGQIVTAQDRKNFKMNMDAFNFLMLSCEGTAFGFVEMCITSEHPEGNAHIAWISLTKRYESNDIGSDYVEINCGFADCKLEGISGDPDVWFQDLEYWKHRLSRIDEGKYAKDELEMKVHIMGTLPKEYESIKTRYNGILAMTPISDLHRDIVDYWKRNGKPSDGDKGDSKNLALMATRKIKGNCRNCGKQGHMARDCKGPKKSGGETVASSMDKTKKDTSKIKCFKCGAMGHYANKCTGSKDGEAKSETGMFVICVSDKPKKEHVATGSGFLDGFFNNFSDDASAESTETVEVSNMEPYFSVSEYGIHYECLECQEEQEDWVCATTDEVDGAAAASDSCLFSESREEDWLVDSGATCHVTHSMELLAGCRNSDKIITVGNGEEVGAELIGTIHLRDATGNGLRLTDVSYVPNFAKNVMSLTKFIEGGCNVAIVKANEMLVTMPNNVVFRAKRHSDRLYYLRGTRYKPAVDLALVAGGRTLSLCEAHRLFEHADTQSVIKSLKSFGWTLNENVMDPCGPCAFAKAKARSVPKSTLKKAGKPGERLFVDFSGPYSPTVGGNTQWLIVVDDFSRKTWCFFTKKK
jgi:Zinc knuckle